MLICGPGVKEHPGYPNMMPRFDAPGKEAASNNCKTCRVKPAVISQETPGKKRKCQGCSHLY